jgi:uncharacterized protein (DUF1800 family)
MQGGSVNLGPQPLERGTRIAHDSETILLTIVYFRPVLAPREPYSSAVSFRPNYGLNQRMRSPTPRAAGRLAGVAITAAALVLGAAAVDAQRDDPIPARPDDATIAHVLNRIGFGPRPGDVARVRQMGLAKYLDQQLHPERIADNAVDSRLADYTTLSMSSHDLAQNVFLPVQELRKQEQTKTAKAQANANRADPSMTDPNAPKVQPPPVSPELRQAQLAQQNVVNELLQAKVLRAVMSDRQLDEVLDDFWFNHFNVYIQKGQVRQYLTEYERDVIRPHVLGNFRDLLGAVAHSPAMLFYLDNFQSSTPNVGPLLDPEMQRRLNDPRLPPFQRQQALQRLQQAKNNMPRGLNENYARELMELHTLGVDGGYTQKDVQEVARALTGWTIDRPAQGGAFVFRPQMHDFGEKTILGQDFPAKHGEDEGERVLDILASHPSTAHHIAFELAQRFVADEPPASLVDRAAGMFLQTRGDLREVTRTIITSPEFFAADAYRAKVKTPLEFIVSAIRMSGGTVVNAQPIIAELRQNMGMPLYGCQPPTGYSMTADAWVNTGALLDRMNFALQLVSGPSQPGAGPGGVRALPPRPLPGAGRGIGPVPPAGRAVQVDVTTLATDTSDATRDRLIELMLAGRVSDNTRKTLARAETPQELVALTLGSPEFQRR